MNSENSKTFDPHRVLLSFSDKINLKKSDKYVALSNLSICYACKNGKIWISSLIIFCIRYSNLLWVYHQKTATVNLPIRIYINKVENPYI